MNQINRTPHAGPELINQMPIYNPDVEPRLKPKSKSEADSKSDFDIESNYTLTSLNLKLKKARFVDQKVKVACGQYVPAPGSTNFLSVIPVVVGGCVYCPMHHVQISAHHLHDADPSRRRPVAVAPIGWQQPDRRPSSLSCRQSGAHIHATVQEVYSPRRDQTSGRIFGLARPIDGMRNPDAQFSILWMNE